MLAYLRSPALALSFITFFGAYLRYRSIEQRELWFDEIFTLIYGMRSYSQIVFDPTDPTPPIYYLLHKLLIGFTTDPSHARALSFAAGLLAIPLIYRLGKSVAGVATGLGAALLLAVSGPHIDFSQEARAYTVLLVLMLISASMMLRTAQCWHNGEDAGRLAHAVFAAASLLAIYTHFIAIFWVTAANAILLVLALRSDQPRARTLQWTVASLWMLILVLPAFWMMIDSADRFAWLQKTGAEGVAKIVTDLIFYDGPWLGYGVGELLLIALLVAGAWQLRNRPAALAMMLTFPVALLAMWAVQDIKPVLMFRTAVFLVIPVSLLLALAAASLGRSLGIFSIMACAGLLLSAHLTFLQKNIRSPQWAVPVAHIAEHARPGDRVILCRRHRYILYRYHASDMSTLPALAPSGSKVFMFPAPADETRHWGSYLVERELDQGLDVATPEAIQTSLRPNARLWLIGNPCRGGQAKALENLLAPLTTTRTTLWQGRTNRLERIDVMSPTEKVPTGADNTVSEHD